MRFRPTCWMAAALLGISACEEPGEPLPDGFGSRDARLRGRLLYLEHCAICHGERADGRGRRRQALSGPPADFSEPAWSRRVPPRRAFETIRDGIRGSSMPAWKILDDAEVWDLVSYLSSVAEHGAEVAGE